MSRLARRLSLPFRSKNRVQKTPAKEAPGIKPPTSLSSTQASSIDHSTTASQPDIPLFTLPSELHLLVLFNLDTKAILALRATCQKFYHLILAHESTIIKSLLPHHPQYKACKCQGIPFLPFSSSVVQTLNQYITLSHRLYLTNHLTDLVTSFVQSEIFGFCQEQSNTTPEFFTTQSRLTSARVDIFNGLFAFEPYKPRFRTNAQRCLRHLVAWLPTYHFSLISFAENCNPSSKSDFLKVGRDLLQKFGKFCLMDCYAFFKVLEMVLKMKLSSRKMLEFSKSNVAKEVVKVLLFGGWEVLSDILGMESYKERREKLDAFINNVDCSFGTPEITKSSRLSRILLHPSRKKLPTSDPAGDLAGEDKSSRASDNTPTLPPIETTPFPKIPQAIARKFAENLPAFDELFLKPAEQILFGSEPEEEIAQWAITRDASHYVHDMLMRDLEDEGRGRDSDEESSGSDDDGD